MKLIKMVRQGGDLLEAVRLRRGMPVRMKGGRTGRVFSVDGANVHVDLDGPNPHCTGVVCNRADLIIKDGVVIADLSARSVRARAPKPTHEQRPAAVVDLERARFENEWKCAPEY
jgi:hypothetical protein